MRPGRAPVGDQIRMKVDAEHRDAPDLRSSDQCSQRGFRDALAAEGVVQGHVDWRRDRLTDEERVGHDEAIGKPRQERDDSGHDQLVVVHHCDAHPTFVDHLT